jgi:glucuronate isomerase
MSFIGPNFLLQTDAARQLYSAYAQPQPILDFHTHLSAQDIADDRRFNDLYDIWIEGDHYKWRAMRANGVAERFCTGNASAYEKYLAWAATVPHTLRNPLYHWTHLELARYFEIDKLLDEKTAPQIWSEANSKIKSDPTFTTQGILRKFGVRALCTTDDPTSDLSAHKKIAASGFATRVYPTFRPDKALAVQDAASFNAWVQQLMAAANHDIATLDDFLSALRQRHEYFHQHGCRLSDHGLERCYSSPCSAKEASSVFDKVRSGTAASHNDHEAFAAFLMVYFGQLDAEKGWTKQMHLGALRNPNPRALKTLGPDTGFDCMGDFSQARDLAAYLGRLESEKALPKIILYNLNPADNYLFSTLIGSFQDGSVPGKLQLGSGWWFLDQKEGMEWQLNALSNTGLLSRFVGMVTDSRSFMSFPRHEYFRRVLCNLLGADMEQGLIPDRGELIGSMVENICFNNARNLLGLELEAEEKHLRAKKI